MRKLFLVIFIIGIIIIIVALLYPRPHGDDIEIHDERFQETGEVIDSSQIFADSLITVAEALLGTPYSYGGATKNGFDCSGFTFFVFKKLGIEIPRSSRGQINAGEHVALEDARKGDLILFTGTNADIRTAGHVGVITDTCDDIIFIHSSSGQKNGVTYNSLEDASYKKRFLEIRRVL